jgi:hypothetical protein
MGDDDRAESGPSPAARTIREGIDRLHPSAPAWQRAMIVRLIRLQHAIAFLVAERLLRRRRDDRGTGERRP